MGLDEEFDRALAEVRELRSSVEELKESLISLEKRTLLRVRGQAYCRLCHPASASSAAHLDPPISEWEQKFHEINHGLGSPGLLAPRDWLELERELQRKKHGGA